MKNKIPFIPYKKLVAGTALVLGLCPAHAQQVSPPQSNIPHADTLNSARVPYLGLVDLTNTGKYNYVRRILPDQPLQTTNFSGNYYRQSTDYFDGLGRPLQTVGRKDHANGNDLVTVKVYDNIGRETYQYLTYAAPTGGLFALSPVGNIKHNVSTQLRGFYDASGPDEHPYAQTIFETSPLGRPVKKMSPGRNWIGASRGISYNYFTNTNWSYNDSLVSRNLGGGFPRWTMAATPGALPVYAGQYASGQLSITLVRDEDGKSSMEMKDKEGHVVMKLAGLTTKAWGKVRPLDYAYTFYIYDELGRLRCVLPPEAAKPTAADSYGGASWNSITQAQMDGLCFSYVYDNRSRVVEKRVPGSAVEYFVYDKRDRIVLRQDGSIRPNFWHYTLYDGLDRPTMVGATLWPVDRQYIQNQVDDNSTWATNELMYYIKAYNLYHADPVILNNCLILKRNYYDDYTNLTAGLAFDAGQFSGITLPSNNTVVPSLLSAATRGLPTWSKSMVVDPENYNESYFLTTVNYYDDKGRVIQTQSQGLNSSVEISSNIYYFQGMLWKNISKHVNPAAVAIPGATDGAITQYTILNTYERNLVKGGGNDLVKKYTQKINDGAEYELSNYSYDHLGRNTVKQWTAGLNLNEYNMRGFMNHIAFRKYDQDIAFNESISYDTGFVSKLYNGNIAGITWWGADHKPRAYGYSYDGLNRLTHAEFNQYDNGSWNKTGGNDFTASNISYDLNGNIKTMNQMGRLPLASSSMLMDALTYTYVANSNMLGNVKDAVSPSATAGLPDFKDDLNGNATTVREYSYTGNGNLELDKNKGISSITYNIYNKAQMITVDGKGMVTYTYDATGSKLRKKLTYANNTQPTETWDYVGNFVYKNNELQYILNEEGRARPMLASNDSFPSIPVGEHWTKFVYDYFVKDHLGNVRSTVTSMPNAYKYLAMHNISTANVEELIFDNITAVRDTKPGSSSPDDMAARLNGGEADKRIGTAIMLQTNPGDRFTINVNTFYDGDYHQDTPQVPLPDMLTSLMGTLMGGVSANPGVGDQKSNQLLIKNMFSNPALAGQLDQLTNANNDPDAPKAHLTYLWFDEKMQLQPAISRSVQIAATAGNWNTLVAAGSSSGSITTFDPGLVAPSRGYLVVYIDNQSIGKDVWFDNLSLNYYTSEVLEEDHYYPFGLALNMTPANQTGTKNPYKYQGIELEKHFGLETYETVNRGLDPQLGRFNSVDPKAESFYFESPYVSMGNNPVSKVDPFGDFYTEVSAEKGNTYTVVDAKADADRNIYVVAPNSKGENVRTGEVIGKSLTEHSFVDDNGSAVKGAEINPNDKSGINFLNSKIIGPDIGLLKYIMNAKGGEPLDFKTNGMEKVDPLKQNEYKYRGVSFDGVIGMGSQVEAGTKTIASARDVGNFGAGWVAGKAGLSWGEARLGFDALQSKQEGRLATEKSPTQRAQWAGYKVGSGIWGKY
jgi:RHS repeat-associated protein